MSTMKKTDEENVEVMDLATIESDEETEEYVSVVTFRDLKEENIEVIEKLPPWAIKYNELVALFGQDQDLIIEKDDMEHKATIYSDNFHKLEALAQVLKLENDGLKIEFVCEGESSFYVRTLQEVFKDNPHFDNIRVATEAGTGAKHVITTFKDETIQYPADNRFVPHGYETTLAEKLVKNLFRKEFRRSVYITKEKTNNYDF